ncbi:hypothetical protein [Aquipuribacter nitratireducens]|uniref:ABC-type Mn/Zn transport systems, ATPase component n=1 Tax=Aquipuribacter nitratireducens TaxID=650104 RepID=A0ABW0GML2_9MICO
MSRTSTVSQTLHDLGGAAWFGGSLMGAVGVNSAADRAEPEQRLAASGAGWGKWAPVQAAAVAAHTLGGIGLLVANRDRVGQQKGVLANTVVKSALTLLAVGATAWSGVLGAKVGKEHVPVEGSTEPSSGTPHDVAQAQQQLKALQWVTPVLTGAVVALGAQQSQQQRPEKQARGRLGRVRQVGRAVRR